MLILKKQVLDLKQYSNIDIYVAIINNKIVLGIDSYENSDVLNKKYIEHILHNNIGKSLKKDQFYITETQNQGKTHYYIIIK